MSQNPAPPALTELVDAFLRYLRVERQLSPLTQSSYRRQLDALLGFAQAAGLTDWRQLDAAWCS